MNYDKDGFEYFIDIDCRVHRVVRLDKDYKCLHSFENIMKNYFSRSEYFGSFNVKNFSDSYIHSNYSMINTKNFEEQLIFKHLKPLIERFYPEMLI